MKKVILLLVLVLLISSGFVFAEVPCKINYQGRLIKDNVPVDGTKTMVFSIYPVATGGSPIWTSGNVSVEVHNGLFRYVIGSGGTDLSSINWTAGQALYLQVMVDGETLTPREELSAYPYAINSHLLEGQAKEYFLNTSAETQTKQGNLNIMGNLGIGTTSPVRKLDIDGGVYLRSDAQTQRTYFPPQAGQDADGLSFRSDSSFANQAANAGIFLKRLAFNDAPGSANDITEKVGLWLGGFHDNSGTGVPLYLGGFLYNQDTPAMVIQSGGNVGIGTTSPGAKLDVNGEIKCSGFADHFGMNWHEAVAERYNSVGWATAVDYSGPGVLLYVQAYGRLVEPTNNRLRITIDGEVWRDYTGSALTVGANGWNILDDSADNNAGVITLMPFKKFSSGLKVEIYNASSSYETSVRVNYLTP